MKQFAVLLLTGVAFLNISIATAQNNQAERAGGAPVSITGCLAQGATANEFTIKDSTGKTVGLMSAKVNLKQHVGHQVTITGAPGAESDAKAGAAKSAAGEQLQVTDLKMVSTTCQ